MEESVGRMRNFYDMIREQEADRLALVEEGKEYTYGELAQLSQNLGNRLMQEHPEEKVIFFREKRILNQLISFFGCQAAGKVPLLVPEDAKDLPEIGEVPEKACMAVMTSGSTGVPKVLYRRYESWADFFPVQNEIFGVTPESRMFAQGSLAFTGNLNLYMAQFSIGATMVAANVFDPRRWAEWMETYKTDVVYLIPRKLLFLPQCIKKPVTTVRHILAGSQSMGSEEAEKLRRCFPNAGIVLYYGASELNYITYLRQDQMTQEKNCVGKPFPGVQVSVEDGEIFVTTPYHVEGVLCPFSLKDLGHMDAAGNLYFDGRKDDIVSIRGRKVSLLKIERALEDIPFIEEAIVAVVEKDGEKRAAAWVTVCDREALCLTEREKKIYAYLKQTLANYELPFCCKIVGKLPHTESGKKDRKVLDKV